MDVGIIDALFELVPAKLDNITFGNFKIAWRHCRASRLLLCRIDPPNTSHRQLHGIVLSSELQLDVEDYYQFMHDLFRLVIGKFITHRILLQSQLTCSPSLLALSPPSFSTHNTIHTSTFPIFIFCSFIDRLFDYSDLGRRIWMLYTLYALFSTQAPPLDYARAVITIPQSMCSTRFVPRSILFSFAIHVYIPFLLNSFVPLLLLSSTSRRMVPFISTL